MKKILSFLLALSLLFSLNIVANASSQPEENVRFYNNGDTGSVEVQVAILTERIKNLTEHLKGHKKDYSCRKGLLMLVARKKRLLNYLKKKSEKRYNELMAKIKK